MKGELQIIEFWFNNRVLVGSCEVDEERLKKDKYTDRQIDK